MKRYSELRKRPEILEEKARGIDFCGAVSMVWIANKFAEGDLETLSSVVKIPEGLDRTAFEDWKLETLFNEILVTGPPTYRPNPKKSNPLRWEKIFRIYNYLDQVIASESSGGGGYLFSPQQRSLLSIGSVNLGAQTAQQLYRYWYILDDQELKTIFQKNTGLEMDKFLLIGCMFHSLFEKKIWIDVDLEYEEGLGFTRSEMMKFFEICAHSGAKFVSEARRSRLAYEAVEGQEIYLPMSHRKSVLRARPIASSKRGRKKKFCSPIPSLLLRRITEGLFLDLKDGGREGEIYGRRFEKYTKDLLNHKLSHPYHVCDEYDVRKGCKSPDCVVSQENCIEFVIECKTQNMSGATRNSMFPHNFDRSALESLGKGIVQIWSYVHNVTQNKDRRYSEVSKSVFGTVLTLHPWNLGDPEEGANIIREANRQADEKNIPQHARIRAGVMWVHELELAVSAKSDRDFLQFLRENLHYADGRPRRFQSYQSLLESHKEERVNGFPFKRKLQELKYFMHPDYLKTP